ncbi:MAG: hypothetical protein CSA09_03620 [Candidatus Contendobacter odensis]|uniref:Glycosyltransferase 2-like domain-containing protein n=1 Tax=Candidatus Contendibacter odensensis TaxID=1400860 RepID=A0A2G6PF34_9GAMM|nr:MAG: hypothetical protein CSA09_03620 [Candidatus Contendobacter odensis]
MSKNHLLVSIIVRSMARPSLHEALESIASQHYPCIEVIVVNAYGPGHPPLDKYCGQFPLHFADSECALDRCSAANLGLDTAHGQYIGFLDDDDLLFPEHVSVLVEALHAHTELQVAYSGVQMIAYLVDGSAGFKTLYNHSFHLPSLRAQNYIPMHAVLFDRILLDSGCRFDENLMLYEDWDFWLQLAEHSKFLHINKITACYRNYGHSGFGMQADTNKISGGRAALFDKWKKRWSGQDLSEAFLALYEGIIHQPVAREPFRQWAAFEEPLTIYLLEQKNLLQQLVKQLSVMQEKWKIVEILEENLDRLSEVLLKQNNELNGRKKRLEAIYQSTSWRITKPLRFLAYKSRQLYRLIRY